LQGKGILLGDGGIIRVGEYGIDMRASGKEPLFVDEKKDFEPVIT